MGGKRTTGIATFSSIIRAFVRRFWIYWRILRDVLSSVPAKYFLDCETISREGDNHAVAPYQDFLVRNQSEFTFVKVSRVYRYLFNAK